MFKRLSNVATAVVDLRAQKKMVQCFVDSTLGHPILHQTFLNRFVDGVFDLAATLDSSPSDELVLILGSQGFSQRVISGGITLIPHPFPLFRKLFPGGTEVSAGLGEFC
jgi:hypothetical protein